MFVSLWVHYMLRWASQNSLFVSCNVVCISCIEDLLQHRILGDAFHWSFDTCYFRKFNASESGICWWSNPGCGHCWAMAHVGTIPTCLLELWIPATSTVLDFGGVKYQFWGFCKNVHLYSSRPEGSSVDLRNIVGFLQSWWHCFAWL